MNNYTLPQIYSQFNYQPQTQMQKEVKQSAQSPIKNGDKLLLAGLAGLATVGVVGIYALKHKTVKLSDIDFALGEAQKSGKKFTGTISDKINDKKIILKYKDGVLQQSQFKGVKKEYLTNELGEKIVKITEGSNSREVNLTQVQNNVKTEQKALKDILGHSNSMSLDDFSKETDKIKYKSKPDIAQIEKIKKLKTFATNGKYSFREIDKNRIEVIKNGMDPENAIVLPKYLYHVTSQESMGKIKASGKILTSKNEQLQGVFFLDSINFVEKYPNCTPKNCKERDLLTGIFRQAGKNCSSNAEKSKLCVIKIPTVDLLNSGKLRERTQEHFFEYQNIASKVLDAKGNPTRVRALADDTKRAYFFDQLVKTNTMGKDEAEALEKEMCEFLHQGFTLRKGHEQNLLSNNAVEFIYNKEINLADFPNLQTKDFDLTQYIVQGKNNVDPSKIGEIFEF